MRYGITCHTACILLMIKMVEVGLAEGPWSLTDHGRRAEMKLKSNLYDLEAWSVLIREAQVC